MLSDSSAAFNTIDHGILQQRLETMYNIKGQALKWFQSYLENRRQIVCKGNSKSTPVTVNYGVPQGSVLGPTKYTMYTKLLGTIIKNHGMQYHMYADDTQIVYLSFRPSANFHEDVLPRLENCISDVQLWMKVNVLKLNEDKTEVIVFTPKKVHLSPTSFQ